MEGRSNPGGFLFFVSGFLLIAVGCRTEALAPMNSVPAVIAHRGASFDAPEHTVAAYDLAVAHGADYIELDVARAAGGTLVVLHDSTLDRTLRGAPGDCTGRVADRPYDRISTCDAGTWFNAAYPSRADAAFAALRTLTLASVLDRYPAARFYIEIKDADLYPGIEGQVAALLESREASASRQDGMPRVFIQSFSSESLRRFRTVAPGFPRVFLLSDMTTAALIGSLDSIASFAHGIGPREASVTRALVDAAHARCLTVHPYTINESADMLSLLGMGVDAIFTDRPGVLRVLIDQSFTAPGKRNFSCAP
jgi:glycerophosphoryl diester phosphodiesterase